MVFFLKINAPSGTLNIAGPSIFLYRFLEVMAIEQILFLWEGRIEGQLCQALSTRSDLNVETDHGTVEYCPNATN